MESIWRRWTRVECGIEVKKEEWTKQDKVCIHMPSVGSEKNIQVFVRKMPRSQKLTGIKLTGQPVSPRGLRVYFSSAGITTWIIMPDLYSMDAGDQTHVLMLVRHVFY